MAIPPSDDSGIRAILGFYYQAISTASLVLTVERYLQRDACGSHQMLSFVRPEIAGQDALLSATSGAMLVQHKFSATPDSHTIKPAELYDIFKKMLDSADRLQSQYNCIPRCCLQTNRPLSVDSQKLLTAAQKGKTCRLLDTTVQHKIKKRIYYRGRTLAQNKRYRKFLSTLTFDSHSFADSIAAFRKRAHAFGILDHELTDRVRIIASALFELATRTVTSDFREADLDCLLTGDPTPVQLCSESVSLTMRAAIADGIAFSSHEPPLYPRVAIKKVQECFADPLIHLFGAGGVGKSALAFAFLDSLISATPPPFVAACHITRLDSNWVGALFGQWRNTVNDNLRRQSLETLLARLMIATPSQNAPLLILLVDGLDERDIHQDRQPLDILLEFVEAERRRSLSTGACPRLQLIVTSRQLDELSQYWVDDPFGHYRSRLRQIEIDGYSPDELHALVADIFPAPFAARVRELVRRSSEMPRNTGAQENRHVPEAAPTSPIIDALTHPPLVTALRHLTDSEALNVLADKIDACRKLSGLYVQWFAKKVQRRGIFQRADEVYQLLAAVLQAADTHHHVYVYRDHWENAITACTACARDARRLYNEACSAGLVIRQTDARWKWRNHFVCLGIDVHSPTVDGDVS